VFEFAGSVSLGSFVSSTFTSKIIPFTFFTGEEELYALGMLSTLVSGIAWVGFATRLEFPVSTTHALVGSIMGFGSVLFGVGRVPLAPVVRTVVLPMLLSPVMGCAIAWLVIFSLDRLLLGVGEPGHGRALLVVSRIPLLYGASGFVYAFLLASDSRLGLGGLANFALPLAVGAVSLVAARVVAVGRLKDRLAAIQEKSIVEASAEASSAGKGADADEDDAHLSVNVSSAGVSDPYALFCEGAFRPLVVISSSFVAFAHGGNDVANGVAPLAAILHVRKTGVVGSGDISMWSLALGGAGIVIGLLTWGLPVTRTIGEKVTKLTTSKAFAVQISVSVVVMCASLLGLPVSTTQILIGCITGVGLWSGGPVIGSALNLSTLKNVAVSWLTTFPAGMLISALTFSLLRQM
jgi:phosphate/sulfate permease